MQPASETTFLPRSWIGVFLANLAKCSRLVWIQTPFPFPALHVTLNSSSHFTSLPAHDRCSDIQRPVFYAQQIYFKSIPFSQHCHWWGRSLSKLTAASTHKYRHSRTKQQEQATCCLPSLSRVTSGISVLLHIIVYQTGFEVVHAQVPHTLCLVLFKR